MERHVYEDAKWQAFKLTAKNWDGLDKYGHVYLQTDWAKGTKDEQTIFHRKCTKNMQTQSKLQQAMKRRDKKKEPPADIDPNIPTSSSKNSKKATPLPSFSSPPPPTPPVSNESTVGKSTRASIGVIFNKDLCIWCREPDEYVTKKKGKTENPWSRVEQKKSWRRICACTPFLEDPIMRERLLAIIAMFPKDDCFFADLHYHKKCWDKYVSHSNPNRK